MARADAVGKDRDTKDTTSAADRAASGKGYSGKGGLDSPSEGGPGPGKGLGGAAGGGSYSGKGGQDSPSEGGPGPGKGLGGGDYSGQGRGADSPSEGGPGRGVSGSSDRGGGEGSRYSGRGGLNSPGEVARGADGFGLNGSTANSPDRPDNHNYAGPTGLGGPGGTYVGGIPSNVAREYTRAYETMDAAGIRSIGGLGTAAQPASMQSFRQAEIQSLKDMALEHLLGTVRSVEARKTDPYNSLVYGTNTPTHANLKDMTIQEVMDFQKGMRKAGHASTAVGAYQTTASTLAMAVGMLGLDPATTKFDEATQDKVAKALVENRAQQAIVDGKIDVDKFAAKLANEWASLPNADGVSAYEGIAGNTAAKGLTHAAIKDIAAGIATGRAVQGDLNISPANPTEGVADVPATDPVDANVAAYTDYGRSRAAAPTSVATGAARTARFRDMYISPHLTLEQQGFTQAYADAQTPEVDRAPVGTAVPEVDTRTAAQPSVSVPSAVAQPVGSGRAVTPTTAAQSVTPAGPASPAVSPVATESQAVQPTQQRGIAAQLAAGGIDVLAGLAPGVGTAASIFNAGAALTGNRTIGERLVDGFLSGEDKGGPARTRESDSLLVRDKQEDGSTKAEETPAEEPAKDRNRFVRLYLTPTEKWGSTIGS